MGNDRLSYRIARFLIFWLVRLFYPKIEIKNPENLPKDQAAIFVLNHPNGLLDPMILMMGLDKQPVSFLAKSTLFPWPVLNTLLNAFGALPVFRRWDEGLRGGPHGDANERNEETFAHCRALLQNGGYMALFPEGATHSEPELLPLKTGAARIALSTEAEANWQLGLPIVPVGLWYEQKTEFRSAVLLVVGEPFTLSGYAADYNRDEHQTVDQVTAQIEAGLDRVVLQAENADLLAAIPVLAVWTTPGDEPLNLAEQHEWTARLLAAYETLKQTNPARLENIAAQARRYANILQTLGIQNPWALELPAARRNRLVWLILLLTITAPVALLGFLMSYLPYRLAGPIARLSMGQNATQIGTVKLLGGTILVIIAWIIEAIIVARFFGWGWGVLLFLLALPLAYVALRWGEGLIELQELASGDWVRLQRGRLARSLQMERQNLSKQIMAAVRDVSNQV